MSSTSTTNNPTSTSPSFRNRKLRVVNTTDLPTESKELQWEAIDNSTMNPQLRDGCASIIYKDFLYLYGGIRGCGGRSSSIEKFNINLGKWENVLPACASSSDNKPPRPRSGHTMTVVQDTFWIYGGEGDSHGLNKRETYDDVYTFNLVTSEWTRMHVSSNERSIRPAPRRGHTSLYLSSQNSLVVFGGTGPDRVFGNDIFFNDTQLLDLESVCWSEKIQTNGGTDLIIAPRSQHSAVLIKNESLMLVFGGLSTQIISTVKSPRLAQPSSNAHTMKDNSAVFADNNLYLLDTHTWKWQKQDAVSGAGPSARYGHCMTNCVSLSPDNAFLYGGKTINGDFDTALHVLNIQHWHWSTINADAAIVVVGGRHKHILESYRNPSSFQLIVYGGCNDKGLCKNKVLKLVINPKDFQATFPSPKKQHTSTNKKKQQQQNQQVNKNITIIPHRPKENDGSVRSATTSSSSSPVKKKSPLKKSPTKQEVPPLNLVS